MSPALLHQSTAIAIYLGRGISPSASIDEPNLCRTNNHGGSLVKETLDEKKRIHIHPSFNIPDGDVTLIVILHLSTLILSAADA
ncbi:hypothetical protein FIBSPDRAFT_538340 [Athelia psychrophila]|uniref:Uncharacterized protein n=1 Tax=Athelia psychrophila TaxID=1759441 RepID=A0A166J1V3_9AGAM|nr:hypothetical protein FIBSPDRAFT_538340 [Fibularhizoctonia sp. CBS 109695]